MSLDSAFMGLDYAVIFISTFGAIKSSGLMFEHFAVPRRDEINYLYHLRLD